MLKINIKGRSYPAYVTMGAMRRFRAITGHEADNISGISDAVVFIYCCVASACRREGEDFDLDLDTFADYVTPDDVMQWQNSQDDGDAQDDGVKKK